MTVFRQHCEMLNSLPISQPQTEELMAKIKRFKLEDLKPSIDVDGLSPDGPVEIVQVVPSEIKANDPAAVVTVYFKTIDGVLKEQLLGRDAETNLNLVEEYAITFDADAALLRLAIEANRIELAHYFDPYLAINTSRIEPYPHQITAVYEKMLPKHPLRYLLADDPGAGKTIMAGLLIKELIARGDLDRCLIVAPGILVEQWQDELSNKFNLEFDIVTSDTGKSKRSGNPFEEKKHLVARLDMLARNEQLLTKLKSSGDWDLIVVDEAHKMSASFYGQEVNYTKRYRLGEELEKLTRHLLLMTATPHNGREADFQLFMALIDGDRFAGRYRQEDKIADLTDIMRRLTKEELLQFDGKPLFPERIARTVQYKLSQEEMNLYNDVTTYVRDEMERVERFVNRDNRHKYVVGFALQLLQRRLASSPYAIYQSLKRRHERLKKQLESARYTSNRQLDKSDLYSNSALKQIGDNIEDLDDEDDFGDEDIQSDQELASEMATTAETIGQLEKEVQTLGNLVEQALDVLENGTDTKWEKLQEILNDEIMLENDGTQRKLIIFTEARDTLNYLRQKIAEHLGNEEAVAVIHGGVNRDDRHKIIGRFMQDKALKILVANDAAGEGVNLQRAYLMVNYDLPWNPNKIEQRFGRIHRIGQTEVCYLWNLVAADTREGDVYGRLLEKLENVRSSLKGHVFDVLGELFDGTSLKQLLLDAIQYGAQPEVKKRLLQQVDDAVNENHIQELLDKRKLSKDFINQNEVEDVRLEMDLAKAKRLQPYHISSFFIRAFEQLGGNVAKREKGRYEIEHVPNEIRRYAKENKAGSFIPKQYERICFEKKYINQKPDAEFIVPGHPLLETVLEIIGKQYGRLVTGGAVMIDDQDFGQELRTVFLMEHSIRDERTTTSGNQQIISRNLNFVTINRKGEISVSGSSPHLDLRPVRPEEIEVVESELNDERLSRNIVKEVREFAIRELVIPHRNAIKTKRLPEIEKVEHEVKARLKREIKHWQAQADKLLEEEKQGRATRLPSQNARRRVETLSERLDKRLKVLDQERTISAATPIVKGAFIVIPIGLLLQRNRENYDLESIVDPELESSLKVTALRVVMEKEYSLGFEPKDVTKKNCGYDIISFDSSSKSYRFIKVKGFNRELEYIYASRNEMLTSLNKPNSYRLALVRINNNLIDEPLYVENPFDVEPKFNYTQYPFEFKKLLAKSKRQ